MSLNKCPRKGTAHLPHPIRLYFASLGGIVKTRCPGERVCTDHDRRLPCAECES